MVTLLKRLRLEFPALAFRAGPTFSWSPVTREVIYKETVTDDDLVANWSLLHEVGHALLEHETYDSDFHLLKLELAAWEKAQELAKRFDHSIDPEHIEDCLDTYRDWLYQRSTCPSCTASSLQTSSRTYQCFNCGTVWHVSHSRMCRPYRRKQKEALV